MNKKSKKKLVTYVVLMMVGLLGYFGVMREVRVKKDKDYDLADDYIEKGEYRKAADICKKLGAYEGAQEKVNSITVYLDALDLMENGEYDKAIKKWESLSGFGDSTDKIKQASYELAKKYMEENDYDKAKEYFSKADGYEKSELYLAELEIKTAEQTKEKIYREAVNLYEKEEYEEALEYFEMLSDYGQSSEYMEKCRKMIQRTEKHHTIAAGVNNSAAITEQGKIKVTGTNKQGQNDIGDFKDIVSVDAYGCFVAGLTKSGKVVYSGEGVKNEQPDVDEWKDIVDIACGENCIVALDEHGKVFGDGHNGSGQLDITDWKNVADIDAGWSFTVALTKKKELKFAGTFRNQKEDFEKKKDEWKNVVSISAGGGGSDPRQRGKGHTVGLCADGTVVAVGDDTHHQCSDVYGWTNIVKVAAGDWYTVGLKEDGTIVITGENFPGSSYIDEEIMEECTDIVDIAAGFGQTLCLKKDGTLIPFGFDDEGKISQARNWTGLKLSMKE